MVYPGFESPLWLLLLLGVPALAWWDVRRTWADEASYRVGRVLLRAGLVSALILALSGPRLVRHVQRSDVVFLVDRSASVTDAALTAALERVDGLRGGLSGQERPGLVLFDSKPEVAVFPGEEWAHGDPRPGAPADGTDLAAAVELALGMVPPAADGAPGAGRIVLVTDGRQTAGDVRRAAAQAAARGIPLYTVALDPKGGDPAVTDLRIDDPELKAGATLEGTVTVTAPGTVVIKLGDEVVHTERVTRAGDVTFEHALDPDLKPGVRDLSATLTPDGGDADPADNTMSTHVVVGDKPRVLLVVGEPSDGVHLVRTLTAEGMDVKVKDASETDDVNLDEVDLVILANAAVGDEVAMSKAFASDLKRYVSDGGGLITLGGDGSYQLGGWHDSALRDVLPVEMDPTETEVEGAVTLVIILDRSGSMGAYATGGKTKIQLADEGAVASMKLLRPIDRIGVMSVDDRVHWDVPVQPVVDRARIERTILDVYATGGGIYTYTSLVAAHEALKLSSTPLKHVILFTDAADTEELVKDVIFGWGTGPNVYDVAREMQADGITVSVIGIGTEYDIHTPYLGPLATHGGGRYYLTDDATELKSIFVKETERFVESELDESKVGVKVARRHPVLDGVDFRTAPQLRGYVKLEPRDTAITLLKSDKADTVLVTWQYGLGQVYSCATDASGKWAADWVTWDGYDRLWTQVARGALRRSEGRRTAVAVDWDGGDAHVVVARRSDGGLTDTEGVRARGRVVNPDGSEGPPFTVPLDVTAPGTWEGRFTPEPGQIVRVQVHDGAGKLLAEQTVVPEPSAETRFHEADRELLAELAASTGGEVEPVKLPPAVLQAGIGRVTPLAAWWLVLAVLLLPLDAWSRRPAR